MKKHALISLFFFLSFCCDAQDSTSKSQEVRFHQSGFTDDFPHVKIFLDSLSNEGIDTALFYGKINPGGLINPHNDTFNLVYFDGNEGKSYQMIRHVDHVKPKGKIPETKSKGISLRPIDVSLTVFRDLLRNTPDSVLHKELGKRLPEENKFVSHGPKHYLMIKRDDKFFYRILPNYNLNKTIWAECRTLFLIASGFNNYKVEK